MESERLSPVSGRRAFDGPEALGLLQKGVILFQRKVHDWAMCTLTGYRRHLDGRSPDTKSPPAWLVVATGLQISLPKKGPRYPKSIPFQNWPLSMRVAFAPQIRWRIRAALTCDVGYALDPVKISREAFGLSARAVAAGSRLKSGEPSGKGGIEQPLCRSRNTLDPSDTFQAMSQARR